MRGRAWLGLQSQEQPRLMQRANDLLDDMGSPSPGYLISNREVTQGSPARAVGRNK